jgi:WD40 repeat protein
MQPFQTLTGFETAAPVYAAIPGPKRGVLAWYARGKLQFQDISSSALGGELGYQDFIMGIAFSPDGMRTAVASGGLLQVINTSVQADVAAQDLIVASPETPVTVVVFSPDGALVAAGVGEEVLIWETTSWAQVAALSPGGPVRLVSFSPDGRALVTVADNNLLKSWRIP